MAKQAMLKFVTVERDMPPKREAGEKVADAAELVAKLKSKGVI